MGRSISKNKKELSKETSDTELEESTVEIDESDLHEFDELDYDMADEEDEDLYLEEYEGTADISISGKLDQDRTRGSLVQAVKSIVGKVKGAPSGRSSRTRTDIVARPKGKGFVEKLRAQLPFLAKVLERKSSKKAVIKDEVPGSFGEMESAANTSGGKKKGKISPVQAVIILGLVVFLLFDDEETPKETTPNAKIQKPKKKPKFVRGQKRPDLDSKKVEAPRPSVVATSKVENTVSENTVSENDAVENEMAKEVKEELETPDELIVEDNLKPVEIEEKTIDSSEQKISDLEGLRNNPTDTAGGEEVTEEINYNSDDLLAEENSPLEEEVTGMITQKILENLEGKLKKKKVEEIKRETEVIVPTSSPSYEDYGRALVYNCNGQHWACVSVSSFEQCKKNYSWHKSEETKYECYPEKVMGSDSSCSELQQIKIDSVADTKFCEN